MKGQSLLCASNNSLAHWLRASLSRGVGVKFILDKYKIYNSKNKNYIKEASEYRYKLKTKEGIYKSITLKEIYKIIDICAVLWYNCFIQIR